MEFALLAQQESGPPMAGLWVIESKLQIDDWLASMGLACSALLCFIALLCAFHLDFLG